MPRMPHAIKKQFNVEITLGPIVHKATRTGSQLGCQKQVLIPDSVLHDLLFLSLISWMAFGQLFNFISLTFIIFEIKIIILTPFSDDYTYYSSFRGPGT